MTNPLSPVAYASSRLADAIRTVPGARVVTTVAASVSPPAVVVGPPRLMWSDYGSLMCSGQPTTCQWNVYLVVALNQYAIDYLLNQVASITSAIEDLTPAVVLGCGPGFYPSPDGSMPAYIITVQAEPVMM